MRNLLRSDTLGAGAVPGPIVVNRVSRQGITSTFAALPHE
jgi:hypothetical protein